MSDPGLFHGNIHHLIPEKKTQLMFITRGHESVLDYKIFTANFLNENEMLEV